MLFWFYGGAFLGGDAWCNRGIAERYARKLGFDAFLVDYCRCPEHTIDDAVLDGCRAYAWLLKRVPASKVMFFGISSGGGVALRVLQHASAISMGQNIVFGERTKLDSLQQPAGAVLCGPWVRYTPPSQSLRENACLDWIVTPGLIEFVDPMMGAMCGGEDRRRHCSPVLHGMDCLCPLLVSTSEHEACWAESAEVVEKAKAANVDVQIQALPFMCHAYVLFAGFLPEAATAEAKLCAWIKAKVE